MKRKVGEDGQAVSNEAECQTQHSSYHTVRNTMRTDARILSVQVTVVEKDC